MDSGDDAVSVLDHFLHIQVVFVPGI